MSKVRVLALLVLLLGFGLGYFNYFSQTATGSYWYRPFKLGLDLKGGTHLVYQADTAQINPPDVAEAMQSLRGVIERRINIFGVAEPLVQVEEGGIGTNRGERLIVELPGVTDIDQAIKLINRTPVLEFKTERPEGQQKEAIVAAYKKHADNLEDPYFIPSPLSGRYLKKAQVQFNQNSLSPSISVEFNDEGAKLFAELTKNNVGKKIGIYLDGELISAPVVREEISGGRAEISGQFTVDEAKQLVRDLNLGALPVPIKLVSTQTIGASLGEHALDRGITAGLYGFALIALFLILWYRLPGLAAVVSLGVYVSIMLTIFKLIPITLTDAGIAGFILSLGTAVDANILIFERTKEELRRGKTLKEATHDGFSRAWLSIRDSNLSTILSAIILFWFGTSLIEGFALTLGIGIVISLFTAITVTRTFLFALGVHHQSPVVRFLFGSGFSQ